MDKERELGQPDGVPCRPGATILDEQDRLWVCDKSGQKYEMILDTRAENPQIIAPPATDTLRVMFWMAIIFTLAALAMGLTQWWRNRKARRPVSLEAWNRLTGDEPTPGKIFKPDQPGPMTTCIPGTNTHINCQHKETLVMPEPIDKNPNSLQDEIKEIYSLIQLARNDVNKIPGFLQVSVNSAMDNLNKARDRIAALGGKVK